jgi:hypothetical protein
MWTNLPRQLTFLWVEFDTAVPGLPGPCLRWRLFASIEGNPRSPTVVIFLVISCPQDSFEFLNQVVNGID